MDHDVSILYALGPCPRARERLTDALVALISTLSSAEDRFTIAARQAG